jgi:hypothetical protein
MGGTRRFEATVQLDSGLIIPASAGVGKVLRSDGSGNAAWGALDLEAPTAFTDVTSSRTVGTAYQPSATRPVAVTATLYVESENGAPSAIGVNVGATSLTATTQIGQVYLLNPFSSVIEQTSLVRVILPAGWYYKFVVLQSGAAQGISQVIESVL